MVNLNFNSGSFPKFLFALLFLFLGNTLSAQTPTVQDCLGAIPVCTEIYSETNSPVGTGNYPNEINSVHAGGTSCVGSEDNSIWYTFTVNQTGNFGFTLTPNNLNDDYDWALFNITNKDCSDIFSDYSMQVSCNAAGNAACQGATGATGMSPYDEQGYGCGTNPPNANSGFSPFNALVPVVQGNTYVLYVSNYNDSPNGYVIDFGVSSGIGIFDNDVPEIVNVEVPDECGGDQFLISFSENIQCNTIDNANFEITGPGGPYTTSLISNICSQGGDYDNIFTVMVDPPVSEPGMYAIALISDGQTEVLDLCDNPSTISSFDYEIPNIPLASLNIGNDTILCEGETLTIDASIPNAENYLWQDGSVNSLLNIIQSGTYVVTVTNTCNTLVDDIEVIFSSPLPISVDLGMDTILCPGEIYPLDVSNIIGNYVWQDGSDDAIYYVSESGIYEVQIETACGEMGSDIVEISFSENNFNLNIGVDTVLCEEDGSYTLNANNIYAIDYQWNDGSTNPNLPVTESGLYSVTISDNCREETDEIEINFTNCTICEVFVPNAFSPDFNGYNDTFKPFSNCVLENYSFKIFNRWGGMVFESNNINTGWDGKFNNSMVSEGVFVYLLEFEVNERGEFFSRKMSGDVTVLK